MTERENVFLTENRREVLNGTSDWADASISNERSRIKNRAETALDELIEVAASPAIDNEDVFDPETVYTLISILLNGSGGLSHGDEIPHPDEVREQYDSYRSIAWKPREDYSQSLYFKIDGGLREAHDTDD